MPIHFDDLDVVSEVAGLSSALIVPCNMCPAATVAGGDPHFSNHLRHLIGLTPCQGSMPLFLKKFAGERLPSEAWRRM